MQKMHRGEGVPFRRQFQYANRDQARRSRSEILTLSHKFGYTQKVVQKHQGTTMPKLKTHSGAAKRFTTTASGKFKRGQSKMRHILTSKATKTKRHLGGKVLISKADTPKIARMLPYA